MTRTPAGRSLRLCATVAAIAAFAVAAGCAGTSEARRVADRFLALYYDQSHVGDAVALCTGNAKARLQFEIKFMNGVPTRPDEHPATFELREGRFPSRSEATYFYRVHLGRPGAGVVFARTKLVHADGQWLVSDFAEKVRGPAAARTGRAQ